MKGLKIECREWFFRFHLAQIIAAGLFLAAGHNLAEAFVVGLGKLCELLPLRTAVNTGPGIVERLKADFPDVPVAFEVKVPLLRGNKERIGQHGILVFRFAPFLERPVKETWFVGAEVPVKILLHVDAGAVPGSLQKNAAVGQYDVVAEGERTVVFHP